MCTAWHQYIDQKQLTYNLTPIYRSKTINVQLDTSISTNNNPFTTWYQYICHKQFMFNLIHTDQQQFLYSLIYRSKTVNVHVRLDTSISINKPFILQLDTNISVKTMFCLAWYQYIDQQHSVISLTVVQRTTILVQIGTWRRCLRFLVPYSLICFYGFLNAVF